MAWSHDKTIGRAVGRDLHDAGDHARDEATDSAPAWAATGPWSRTPDAVAGAPTVHVAAARRSSAASGNGSGPATTRRTDAVAARCARRCARGGRAVGRRPDAELVTGQQPSRPEAAQDVGGPAAEDDGRLEPAVDGQVGPRRPGDGADGERLAGRDRQDHVGRHQPAVEVDGDVADHGHMGRAGESKRRPLHRALQRGRAGVVADEEVGQRAAASGSAAPASGHAQSGDPGAADVLRPR